MSKRAAILLLALATIFLLRPPAASAAVSVSVSFFYDELSPYGRWENVGRYGHCWIPEHVAVGWQPYTDGEWAYTDYGWTWISYDPWGGDPYHYGTWVWEPPFGWVWVPGTVWGPAWVTWCYSDAYVGWAPIPPSLQISFSGYAGPAVVVSHSAYVFVPVNRFAGVRVTSARLPVAQNTTLMQRTQRVTSFGVTNGIVVNRGPSVQRIESAAHVRIPRASIDVAKSRPAPMTAGGSAAKGKHVSIVAPASVRAREFKAHAAGASAGTGGEKHAVTPHGTAASPKVEQPPPRHEAAPKHHEAPPPVRHDSASQGDHTPPSKHGKAATPPPHHEPPPPVRHEVPPPHESPPQTRYEATPSPQHEKPPPAAHREGKPPKHEPPPPGRQGASRQDFPASAA